MTDTGGAARGTVPWSGPGDGRQQVHLVGFMGAGKSTVGARLARLLVWSFLDLDVLVERHAGAPVPSIFAERGEAAFREMESWVLRQAIQKPRVVLALGGGTFMREDNRRVSAARGLSVWLDCPLEILRRRVGETSARRPLWRDPQALADLYEARRQSYAWAEMRVDADRDPDAVAAEIARRLGMAGAARADP